MRWTNISKVQHTESFLLRSLGPLSCEVIPYNPARKLVVYTRHTFNFTAAVAVLSLWQYTFDLKVINIEEVFGIFEQDLAPKNIIKVFRIGLASQVVIGKLVLHVNNNRAPSS